MCTLWESTVWIHHCGTPVEDLPWSTLLGAPFWVPIKGLNFGTPLGDPHGEPHLEEPNWGDNTAGTPLADLPLCITQRSPLGHPPWTNPIWETQLMGPSWGKLICLPRCGNPFAYQHWSTKLGNPFAALFGELR